MASIPVLKCLPDPGKDALFLQRPRWRQKAPGIGIPGQTLYDDVWIKTFQKSHDPVYVCVLIQGRETAGPVKVCQGCPMEDIQAVNFDTVYAKASDG